MKNLFRILGVMLLTAACAFTQNLPGASGNPSALSRPGGVFYAPGFTWQGRVISGNSSTGAVSIVVAPNGAGGSGVMQLIDGSSISLSTAFGAAGSNLAFTPLVVDWGQTNAEYVTPTAVSVAACPAGNLGVGGSLQ